MKKLYALYDRQTEFFGVPICCITDGDAIRSLAHTVMDPESQVHRYLDDYTLYHIGEYDPITGLLTPLGHPTLVASARTVYDSELRRQTALRRQDGQCDFFDVEDIEEDNNG